jgi:hypothetical protein
MCAAPNVAELPADQPTDSRRESAEQGMAGDASEAAGVKVGAAADETEADR